MGGLEMTIDLISALHLKQNIEYSVKYLCCFIASIQSCSFFQCNSSYRCDAGWHITFHVQGENSISLYGHQHVQPVHSCGRNISMQGKMDTAKTVSVNNP